MIRDWKDLLMFIWFTFLLILIYGGWIFLVPGGMSNPGSPTP